MSYFYRVYGVGIQSDCGIIGLGPAEPGPTLFTIQFETGPEPDWAKRARLLPGHVRLRQPEDKTTADPAFILTEHGKGACHELAYSDGARFVVDENAQRLWGCVHPPLTQEDLCLYLLGPVMGFLLRHRHLTCLHASGVEMHGRAVLLSGNAGFGKSTTAAALALRGAPVLSDDIIPVTLADGRYWAIPGYPRVCLWPDAVTKLLGNEDALSRLTPTWDKRYLPLDGVGAKFAGEKRPVGAIYLFAPRVSEERVPRIEELSPRVALLELVQNTYMNWLLDRERRAEEFDELWRITQLVPVRRVIAHTDGRKLEALCERIFEDAASVLAKS